jgi:hypothetical protein
MGTSPCQIDVPWHQAVEGRGEVAAGCEASHRVLPLVREADSASVPAIIAVHLVIRCRLPRRCGNETSAQMRAKHGSPSLAWLTEQGHDPGGEPFHGAPQGPLVQASQIHVHPKVGDLQFFT